MGVTFEALTLNLMRIHRRLNVSLHMSIRMFGAAQHDDEEGFELDGGRNEEALNDNAQADGDISREWNGIELIVIICSLFAFFSLDWPIPRMKITCLAGFA